ncbi:dTDP-glucose 4,6-dehydratase [Olsenella sp. DSM 107455]|uniref:dTDP-glucose 4,6-dehydratase n=1 Tax=Thermophilibacter gallinarum TaxID=2779357 RepID=A0ABR9QSE1_9ACTN|nr:dTDP-glucose 4,6-dehydratase [Thermophilibacter gallinarum]MBE5024000.1 dTDP-glucose 4,6-dehydratase [Thermophilibacter gallinarum]
MKTYLVTGGAGFIGSNFVQFVLANHDGVRVVNVDALTYAGNLENLAPVKDDPRYTFVHADICDRARMRALIAEYDPTYVVNFAAESHVDRSIENPSVFAVTNVLGTISLLDAVRDAWTSESGPGDHRYLQVSTDEVYGTLSLDEPDAFFRESTPLSPHSPYSASKASADMFVLAYADTFGLPVNITRCSNNYGPYQFPEKLIPLMIHNAMAHEPLPVYGDGLNVRDWLYVEDHCKAIDLVLERGRVGEVYNVGGHNERNNMYIVERIISELSGRLGDPAISSDLIRHVEDRKGHDRRYGIAPDKIYDELGWEPETPFEDGIGRTISWYLGNQRWVDHVTSGSYRQYFESMYGNRRILSEE